MKEPEIDDLKNLLKDALPSTRGAELQRDLWPAMLQRLDQRAVHVPWWDWALIATLAAALIFFPGIIPALLYHL
jgi:hypothetical protein